jgi:ubiquinone/menaquinone biosynthesis C-methylase UbiE
MCLYGNHSHRTGLHERLDRGALCADIGCGCGLVLKELASAYPNSTFHGYDTSCKALARAEATVAGLSNVTLKNPDNPDEQMPEKTYDFIITMDAIHDMSRPDLVLRIARKALKDDAWGYLIADFKCKESCAANIAADPGLTLLAYGVSVMLCLNSAMSEENSLGLGTMGWHAKLAEEMLTAAGFSGFEQLQWQSPVNNFYWAKVS